MIFAILAMSHRVADIFLNLFSGAIHELGHEVGEGVHSLRDTEIWEVG